MTKRKSILWNIWKAQGEPLNVGRVHAWADTDPEKVVDMFIDQRQRLNSRPLGMVTSDYVARAYPVNSFDDWGD